MRLVLVFMAIGLLAASGCDSGSDRVRLTGSGASFPYPIYSEWFKTFSREQPNISVNYQAKGSGAGVRDFINGTVDFAGSDAALSDEELVEIKQEVLMLPLTAGSVVLAYNLAGVEAPLRLARDVYPAIMLGEIERWSDPRVARDNPGVELPDLPITLVRRADSSGTTFALTNHLSAISSNWRDGPGTGKSVVWPSSSQVVAAPRNDGVTATIMQTPGAIGYVEVGFARQAGLTTAALQNRSGQFVEPNADSGQAALKGGVVPDDLRVFVTDPEQPDAYPIVSYTWLLVRAQQEKPGRAGALRELIRYCLDAGQEKADAMGYIPLPDEVIALVRGKADQIQ